MAVLLALGLFMQAFDPGGATSDAAPAPVADEAPVPDDPPPVASQSPHGYLYATYPGLARRLDCMINLESTWSPSARSGPYVGLAQFDLPTWMETPPGRAGASRYDPYASIDAMAWGVLHLGWSRWPVTSRRC